ncbi:MAG: carbohydrate ABC transporter permease [Candidatus Izemoplasmatales bacterium]|uniref:Sugar ABC transporter permease n=1 Tax=Hujiaoplasma nucleasis TaxID=2725268 RepID=A0A7L6N2D3_9MOLU|nr:sugar ABC transporter permease [Hujiaoplasma nucleasis]QLY40420.1 sugar ABC transporter permease [Hujiaoplasma nucleasis]
MTNVVNNIKSFFGKIFTVIKTFFWDTRRFFNVQKRKVGAYLDKRDMNLATKFPGWARALLYLSPALIVLAVFTFWPIINAFRLLTYENYDMVNNTVSGYTIFGNFIRVINDESFMVAAGHTEGTAILNTIIIVFISVPLSIFIALFISVALNSIKPLKSFFQTIYFLPYVTNTIAIGLVIAYMFKTDGGLVNDLFGLGKFSWVESGAEYWRSMFVLIFYSIWGSLAFKIMVFLTSIQGIDKQYYQAAAIDATPRRRIFSRITVPLISPMIFYILVTSVIGAFKIYNQIVALFGVNGKPAGVNYTMQSIVMYIYQYIGANGNLGVAAAGSLILFTIILILTLVQMQVSKKRVHY